MKPSPYHKQQNINLHNMYHMHHYGEEKQLPADDPYYPNTTIKPTRVNNTLYQASVPNQLSKQKIKTRIKNQMQHVVQNEIFMPSNLSEKNFEDYLQFVKQIMQDAKSSSLGLVLTSSISSEDLALDFLAKMNYSVTKAKFYLLFPTLYKFNEYCRSLDQTSENNDTHVYELTEEEMDIKIKSYFQNVQESRISQNEQWRKELEEQLQTQITLTKFNSIIEQGRAMKCEIPDYVKEYYEKSNKFSKEIKKIMIDRANLKQLISLEAEINTFKILTPEMILLRDQLEKCKAWVEKAQTYQKQRINIKTLQMLTNEFKSLPLEYEGFREMKKKFDEAYDLMENLPYCKEGHKTRGTHVQDKVSITIAQEYAYQIDKLQVDCEEFDQYKKVIEKTQEFSENFLMYMEDDRAVKCQKTLISYASEINQLLFLPRVSDKIKDYYDYFILLERIKRNLLVKLKFEEVVKDLKECEDRGFCSQELVELKNKTNKIKTWYENVQKILDTNSQFELSDLLQDYTELSRDYVQEDFLNELVYLGNLLGLESHEYNQIAELQYKVDQWKKTLSAHMYIDKENDNNQFKEMFELLREGMQYNVSQTQLQNLFERLKNCYQCILKASLLIQEFYPNFKSQIIQSEEDYNKIEQDDKLSDYELLYQLIEQADGESLFNASKEREYLNDLKREGESWNQLAREALEKPGIELDDIKDLIQRSRRGPVEEDLLIKLEQVFKTSEWNKAAKDYFECENRNQSLINLLEEAQIKQIIKNLDDIGTNEQACDKHKIANYYFTNYKVIMQILELLISTDTKKEIQVEIIEQYLEKLTNLLTTSRSMNLTKKFKKECNKIEQLIKDTNDWIKFYSKLTSQDKKRNKSTKQTCQKQKNIKTEENVQQLQENISEKIKSETDLNQHKDSEMDIEEHFSTPQKLQQSEKIEEEINVQKEMMPFQQQQQQLIQNQNQENWQTMSLFVINASNHNYYYYYKLALLIKHFYDALRLNMNIPELEDLLSYLKEIYQYILYIKKATSNKEKMKEMKYITDVIKQGRSIKCYTIERSKLKKKEKMVQAWLYICRQILDSIPKTNLKFKQSKKQSQLQEDIAFGRSVVLQEYAISFNENKMIFELVKRQQVQIKEEDGDSNQHSDVRAQSESREQNVQDKNKLFITQNDSKGTKRISKRKKTLNRLLLDEDFKVYNASTILNDYISEEFGKDKVHNSVKKKRKTKLPKQNLRKKSVTNIPIIKKKRKYVMNSQKPRSNSRLYNIKLSNSNPQKQQQIYVAPPFELKEENLNEQYCICRRGHDNIAFMIECDKCKEWFHGECLGVSKSVSQNMNDFYCFGCIKRYNIKSQVESFDFIWDKFNKLSLDRFDTILQEGLCFCMNLQELQKLQEVEIKFYAWLERARQELKKGSEIDKLETLQNFLQSLGSKNKNDPHLKELEKEQKERDRQIFNLYLESIGLVIHIQEADDLLGLLHKRDLARKILELLNTSKATLKSIERLLNKCVQTIKVDEDDQFKELLKNLKEKYTISQRVVELINNKLEKPSQELDNLKNLFEYAENQNLFIDKIEQFKKYLDQIADLEKLYLKAIEQRSDLSRFQDLCNQVESLKINIKSKWYENLKYSIQQAEEWERKAKKFLNEGLNSGYTGEQLEEELLDIPIDLQIKLMFVKSKSDLIQKEKNLILPQQQTLSLDSSDKIFQLESVDIQRHHSYNSHNSSSFNQESQQDRLIDRIDDLGNCQDALKQLFNR